MADDLSLLLQELENETEDFEFYRKITDFVVEHFDEITENRSLVAKFTSIGYMTLSQEEEENFKRKLVMGYFERNAPVNVEDALFVLNKGYVSDDVMYDYNSLKLIQEDDFEKLLDLVDDKEKFMSKLVNTLGARDLSKYPSQVAFAYLNSPDNEFIASLRSIYNFASSKDDLHIKEIAKQMGVEDVNSLVERFGEYVVLFSILNNFEFEDVDSRVAELILVKPRLEIAYMNAVKYGKLFEDLRKDIAVLIDDIESLKMAVGMPVDNFELTKEDEDFVLSRYSVGLFSNEHHIPGKYKLDAQPSFTNPFNGLDNTYSRYANLVIVLDKMLNSSYVEK